MTTPNYSNYNARLTGDYGDIWTNTGKCVFCDLREKYIIKELDDVVLTVNIFPYIDGHLLLIPRRHFEHFNDITEKEWTAIMKLSKLGLNLVKEVLNEDKCWILFRPPKGYKAGKTVTHAHMHIIPYYDELAVTQYKEIKIPPIDLAEKFRKASK